MDTGLVPCLGLGEPSFFFLCTLLFLRFFLGASGAEDAPEGGSKDMAPAIARLTKGLMFELDYLCFGDGFLPNAYKVEFAEEWSRLGVAKGLNLVILLLK